jgi:hypothetical protein
MNSKFAAYFIKFQFLEQKPKRIPTNFYHHIPGSACTSSPLSSLQQTLTPIIISRKLRVHFKEPQCSRTVRTGCGATYFINPAIWEGEVEDKFEPSSQKQMKGLLCASSS